MATTKPALDEVSGYLGVGSLQLLGAFFIVDGLTGFYLLVEKYAGASAFAIIFTVPLLVISYVLGLLSSLAVEALMQVFVKPALAPSLYAQAVRSGSEPLVARYVEVERHSRLLHGCTFAFVLLGSGSFLEQRNLEGFGSVGVLCFVAGIVIAALCPILAFRLQTELRSYVQAVVATSTGGDA